MALLLFNAMSEGFVKQASDQIQKRVFENPINKAAFAGATRQPILTVSRIEKVYSLDELGRFAEAISTVLPLGDDDAIAIRRKSGVLPENLPEDGTIMDKNTGDMNMSQWWEIRQAIYSKPRDNAAELAERLDNAKSNAELSQIKEDLNNG